VGLIVAGRYATASDRSGEWRAACITGGTLDTIVTWGSDGYRWGLARKRALLDAERRRAAKGEARTEDRRARPSGSLAMDFA
jgi:hypothetical protein